MNMVAIDLGEAIKSACDIIRLPLPRPLGGFRARFWWRIQAKDAKSRIQKCDIITVTCFTKLEIRRQTMKKMGRKSVSGGIAVLMDAALQAETGDRMAAAQVEQLKRLAGEKATEAK